MLRARIKLNNTNSVKDFVKETSHFNGNLDMISGRYVVDGKSIMGLFSLDLSKEVEIVVHGISEVEEKEFIETLKKKNFDVK